MRIRSSLTIILALVAGLLTPIGAVAEPPPTDGPVALGSVEQVAVTGASYGTAVRLVAEDGVELQQGEADAFGSLLFRDVPAGDGYRVHVGGPDPVELGPLTVMDPEVVPASSLYDDQTLAFGQVTSAFPTRADVRESMVRSYLEARDGTLLSYSAVAPPGTGPWPTLVEYTGYDTGWNEGSQWHAFVADGYAVVGINIRGTGCSGGAFDYFETLQSLDGYDAIETLGAQNWTAGIGMIGWSYAGISQLFVGATQPPSLDALVPGSTVGDLYRDVLRPGGILNPGFGLFFGSVLDQESAPPRLWIDDELPIGPRDRYPSAIYGGDFNDVPPRISWQRDLFDPARGAAVYDTPEAATCRDNHALRLQNDLLLQRADVAAPDPGAFVDDYFEARAPANRVSDIAVPTLLVHTWQDEQTAGRAALMGEHFDPDTLWFIGTNGDHREYLMTHVRADIDDFLSAFVAGDEHRRTAWMQRDRVTIHLGTAETAFALPPGATNPAQASFTHAALRTETLPSFPRWSAAGENDVLRLHLQPDGSLAPQPAGADGGSTSYVADPTARPDPDWITGIGFGWVGAQSPFLPGGNPWRPVAPEAAATFVTDPVGEELVLVGPASVDLWLASGATDTDVEVQLSEVRPDGQEVFINTGWLRASQRALDPVASSTLQPIHTHAAEDVAELEPGDFTPMRVEVFPFGHVIAPGSRLKLSIEAPGGNRLTYRFRSVSGGEVNQVGHSTVTPSSIALAAIVPSSAASPPITRCWADSTRSYLNSQPCAQPAAPAAPTGVEVVLDPATSLTERSATISWDPVPGATAYRVGLWPSGTWIDVTAPSTSLQVPHLPASGEVRARVVAQAANGRWSVISAPATADLTVVRDDCRAGGWQAFTDPPFRNQGACVSTLAQRGGPSR